MTSILRQAGQKFNLNASESVTEQAVETIHIGALTVDHRYQRQTNPRRVKKIIDNYDPNLIGIIIAHRRQNGRLVILDGQHRVEALREMFGVNHRISVLIHLGLTLEDEARLFRLMNDERLRVNPKAMWQAALLSGDEVTTRLNSILEHHGIQTAREGDRNNHPRVLHAVATLRDIATPSVANRGGGPDYEHVDRVLSILMATWGDKSDALHTDVLKGMSAFLRRYGHLVDDGRVIATLQRDGVLDVRQRGNAIKTTFRQESSKAFGRSIASSYNYRLHESNRLPDWDSKK